MKKMRLSLFSCLTFSAICQLNAAAHEGKDFVEMAKRDSPAHHRLYVAAKIGDKEFLAIYKSTDSDLKLEKGTNIDYKLLKVKVGSKDKIKEVPLICWVRHETGEVIDFMDKILHLPCRTSNPLCLPLDPSSGSKLWRCKLRGSTLSESAKEDLMNLDKAAFDDRFFEKLALTLFYLKH